jgi:uncharacterized membrane protein required for colicin V production
MLLDLIAFSILALFTLMGALRGGLASFTGLAALLLSYWAAVWAAGSLGDSVSARLGLPPFLGPVAAGTAAFLATALLVGVLGAVVKREVSSLRGDAEMGPVSRWIGGFCGAARGGLIVLLLAWLAIWLDAARETGSFAGLEAAPRIDSSSTAKLTEKVVHAAVRAAMDDGTSSAVVARFASRPGASVRSLQELLSDRRIETLQQDRFFWALVENGAFQRAMNQRSFREIAYDERLRTRFADLGVISPLAAADAAEFRNELGPVLREVGPKLKGLAEDPELQRLARDPQIQSLLESGDTLALMRHPGIQSLASRVSGGR